MLANAPVRTTLAVTNLERSRNFYSKSLGLPEIEKTTGEGSDAAFQCGGGTELYIYQRPDPSGSSATAASFEVNDLASTMETLRSNGVTFEDYDFPGLKTENGVATLGKILGCWFKDPDGNILAITQVAEATQEAAAGQTN